MSENYTILIIDDLRSSVRMIERFLSEYNIISAESGREGIMLAEKLMPDLILLDVMMPEMTGFDVCEELKKTEMLKDIPVIFLTSCNRKEDIDRSFDVGAFDYITKPISGKALKAKIHAVFSILDRIKNKRIHKVRKRNDATEIFVRGMSHNFNNMFGGILGIAQLLGNLKTDEPKVMKYAKMISSTAANGAKLVSQLLEFSQSSDLEFLNVCVTDIIGEVCEYIRDDINDKIVVKTELAAKNNSVIGDYDKLCLVMQNLVLNASEAMEENPEILIKTQDIDIRDAQAARLEVEVGAYLKISVVDNGCGVSEENKDRIFEPFFSTYDLSEAKGLGLAEAKGIIQGHRGAIEYKNRAEGGSEFSVYLPVNKKVSLPLKGMVNGTREGNQERILLVDDEDISLIFAEEMLRKAGYEVITAVNGEEALSIFKKECENIDLVLTDIIMPRMNGLELAENLREFKPDVKLILMSGHSVDLEERKIDWVKGVMKKPFRGSEIIKIIDEALA